MCVFFRCVRKDVRRVIVASEAGSPDIGEPFDLVLYVFPVGRTRIRYLDRLGWPVRMIDSEGGYIQIACEVVMIDEHADAG